MRKNLVILLILTLAFCSMTEKVAAQWGSEGAWGSIINYLKVVNTHIIPSVDNTYNLGSASKQWANAFLKDAELFDDTPHLGFKDTDSNVGYMFHLESGVGAAPFQNFQLWRGTYAGSVFSVNPDSPVMWFDNSNNPHFSAGLFVNETSDAFAATDGQITITSNLPLNTSNTDGKNMLTFKNTNLNLGHTYILEADTFGAMMWDSTEGALEFWGSGSAGHGLALTGIYAVDNTVKTTAALGAVSVAGAIVDTDSINVMGNNANILVLKDYTTAKFIFSKLNSTTGELTIPNNGVISSPGVVYINIDAANTSTTQTFEVRNNGYGTSGSLLFRVNEQGDAEALSFTIGANTLTTTEFAYLDGISGYVYRAGGTDVAVADGGTNLSSYAVGDILYASAATTIGKLADVATGSVLVSGGVGVAPAYSATPTLTSFTSTAATGTQPYACTSTTLNTNLNADKVDGIDGFGYTLQGFQGAFNPADATTYHFGSMPTLSTGVTTSALQRLYIPKAGTIKSCYLVFIASVLGSAETSTVNIRLNDTTNTVVSSSVTNNANPTVFSNTALSIAVVAGDYIELQWVTPTWVTTNPTTVRISAVVYIE